MIEQLFQDNHGFVTTKMLKSYGVHHYQIKELLAQQTISKLKQVLVYFPNTSFVTSMTYDFIRSL